MQLQESQIQYFLKEPLLHSNYNNQSNNALNPHYPIKDFSSIQKLVKTPPLKKIPPQQSPFPTIQNQLVSSTFISQRLKRTTIQLRQNLRNQFYTYDNVDNFQFYFPQSKFPPVPKGQKNCITYQQKNIVQEENTFRDRLSPQQIQQIRQNGQFNVKSSKQWVKLPYVWKMNDTLFKGIKNVQQDWIHRLQAAHAFFYNAWGMLTQNLPKQCIKIGKWPWRVFSLFVGKKAMNLTYSVNYQQEVAMDFWKQVMTKYYIECKQWGSQLWLYFNIGFEPQSIQIIPRVGKTDEYKKQVEQQQKLLNQYYKRLENKNKSIEQINKITNEFEVHWSKMKKRVFNQITESITSKIPANQMKLEEVYSKDEHSKLKQQQKQQDILEALNQQKYNYYINYLGKSLPKNNIPLNVVEAILTILALMQISSKIQRSAQKKINQQRTRIQKQIKQEYPIRSLNYAWYENKMKDIFQPIATQLNQQIAKSYVDQGLNRKMNPKQVEVYRLWLEYRKSYQTRLKHKKQLKQCFYFPRRVFQSTYALLPPYTVFKHQQNQITGQPAYYQMTKQRTMKVATAHQCWKFYLYCMRVKCWTINSLVALFYTCWVGMFGLRCLCGIDQFAYDQYVNATTGQIIQYKRKPVLGHFSTVMDGISKSRNEFEALPDTGIFGKNCSQLYNLIECYLFRFLIVGIFVTLIFYPVAIILVSLLAFLLIITIWAWIPLVLLVTYLFNIFIYQFESSVIPNQCSARIFPLLSLFISLVFSFIKILFYIIVFFIISPLVCLIVLIYSCVCRCLRSTTDCVMLYLISCLGRTPSRNTAIARKISGPGMSKQYYMSINEEDLYILVQSQLQKLYMEQLSRITNQKLNGPVQNFLKVVKLIVEPLAKQNTYQNYAYNYSSPALDASQNSIQGSVNKLKLRFSQEYQQYVNRFPNRPYNTRFTQDQISSYFENTLNIVKSFVNKTQSNKWIFQHFGISQNDFQQLTRRIWTFVFQCGEQIFQPLQKIDQRFKLEDQYTYDNDDYGTTGLSSFKHKQMKTNINQVMQALHGQVDLKPRRANFSNFKHNLIQSQKDIFKAFSLFQMMNANSGKNVNFSNSSPQFTFYPHLHIKEAIKSLQTDYNKHKEENERNQEWW